jgi:glucose-1-phosphate cytidylyltransferase
MRRPGPFRPKVDARESETPIDSRPSWGWASMVKAVILAGGKGTRLAEETVVKPKPMVEIGSKPILWHILKMLEHHGLRDFVIAVGYRGEVIVDYFRNFHLYSGDFTFDMRSGSVKVHTTKAPDWRVTVAWTGLETFTGGRLKRVAGLLGKKPFLVTYGDGLANVDVKSLLEFHRSHGKLATVTAVRPTSRFGTLEMEGNRVKRFSEKPQFEAEWINGGFMVMEPEVLSYIESDGTVLERDIMERLAREKQLMAFRHEGFWQPMDNLRERLLLEGLWDSGSAPWKVWND